ncbi:MAG: hypothetical protein IJG02_05155, partial [Thermoguttaceae bacterium]|nr:hypothetical protein [Thermoguttaceae bacterium]
FICMPLPTVVFGFRPAENSFTGGSNPKRLFRTRSPAGVFLTPAAAPLTILDFSHPESDNQRLRETTVQEAITKFGRQFRCRKKQSTADAAF